MAEVTLDLIQTLLQRVLDGQRAIATTLDGMRADIVEIKERLAFLEGGYASLSRRVDRIEQRLERIERRLDLVES